MSLLQVETPWFSGPMERRALQRIMSLQTLSLRAPFNIAGITFNAGAPAYTMTGNTFNLTTGITNSSANTQTFSNTGGLSSSAGITFTMGTSGTGAITVTGTLANSAGNGTN